jgi:hypothetical protein
VFLVLITVKLLCLKSSLLLLLFLVAKVNLVCVLLRPTLNPLCFASCYGVVVLYSPFFVVFCFSYVHL